MPRAPSVSVIIAAFSEERWTDLVEAVDSVSAQTYQARETIVVIDHNPGLFAKATAGLPEARVLENAFARGASGARNTGAEASGAELLAFLDDDAAADPRWLENLTVPFSDVEVIGVGGRLEPVWHSQRPRWFAPEFDWVVGASYRGMPEGVEPIRNVWSNNMAIRHDVFDAVGGFRVGFGKTGARSRPEDTELCLRAGAVRSQTHWTYQPAALAHHKVPAERETFRFFVRRCFAEGQGKADLAAMGDPRSALSSERAYTRTVVPKGFITGLGETVRGDPMGLARSGAIVVGLGAAAAGLARERWRHGFGRSGTSVVPSRHRPGPALPVSGDGPRFPRAESGPSVNEPGTGPQVSMRILVDQSGYDLLNMGDVAMLQACVRRLDALWPQASIAVICHDADRLARYCPGTTPVRAGLGRPGSVPRKLERVRLGLGQVHKMVRPYTCLDRRQTRYDRAPRSLTGAVRWADVVVASGGGYLNDTWWWHGFGVLSVLDLAQRLGKPTAMFGQGLGPLTHPVLRRQARRVLPRLKVLGLREGVTGLPLADALGVDPGSVVVTGDDAMQLAGSAPAPAQTAAAQCLGVNARVSGYAGVDGSVAAVLGTTLAKAVAQRSAAVVGLPVSRYQRDSDLSSIRALWPGPLPAGSVVRDLQSPDALASAAASCRVVVTGSYHAAVFALAAGVPTVCLTNSDYYNAKFSGIAGLFPAAAEVVPLTGRDVGQLLLASIDRAWDIDEVSREAIRERARTQAAASAGLYERFARLASETRRRGDPPAVRDEAA